MIFEGSALVCSLTKYVTSSLLYCICVTVYSLTLFSYCVIGRLLRVLMELVTLGDSQGDNGEDCSVMCER